MQEHEVVLSLKNITKLYPGVTALDNVSVEFRRGEVHALIGENGAGKSTLIKTIAGAISPEKGAIVCEGREYTEMTPALSRGLGIEVVYQEFNLIAPLTAAENIFLGERKGNLVDWKHINQKAEELFELFQTDISPDTLVRDLPSAKQQIVEIAKAISKNVKILILDEPTAPLTVAETEHLFDVVRMLKNRGVTVIYISHRLDEIFQICDRITVLRDGQFVQTLDTGETNRNQLISLMVGRELTETYPSRRTKLGEVSLRVESLTTEKLKGVSFEVHKGEILGLSGLIGAGRTETARAIFGADKKITGDIYINGQRVDIKMPKDAIDLGIGLIPEDRKRQGVFLRESIRWNTSIVNIRNISRNTIVDRKREEQDAQHFREKMRIRTPSIDQTVGNLSGGNQQKVVLAKTLAANSDIVIFDEPTRGIDVGARYEIYLLMNELVAEGKSIIMITSDMEELLGMSDRILVFCEGQIAGELQKEEFSQVKILELASGE